MDFLPSPNTRRCRRCNVLVAGTLPRRRALCSGCSKPLFAPGSGPPPSPAATLVLAEHAAQHRESSVPDDEQPAAQRPFERVRIGWPVKEDCCKTANDQWKFVFALNTTPTGDWCESWDATASERTIFAYVAGDRIFLHCAPEKLHSEFELLKAAVDATNHRVVETAERESVLGMLDSLSYS